MPAASPPRSCARAPRAAADAHQRAAALVARCGAHARAGQASGDAHLPGAAHASSTMSSAQLERAPGAGAAGARARRAAGGDQLPLARGPAGQADSCARIPSSIRRSRACRTCRRGAQPPLRRVGRKQRAAAAEMAAQSARPQRRCCASPRSSRERPSRSLLRAGRCRCLWVQCSACSAAPPARSTAKYRARELFVELERLNSAPRRARCRMGAAAARAERLVDLRLRRARRQRAAAHEHPRLARHRDRAAMNVARAAHGAARRQARARRLRASAHSFALRQWLLFALLLRARARLARRAVDLQLVDHGFLAARAMRASRALPQSSRIAATSSIATASRWRSARRWIRSGSIRGSWRGEPSSCRSWRRALGTDRQELTRHVSSNMEREFLYVARGSAAGRCRARQGAESPGV